MPSYQPTVISYSSHGLTKNANAFVIADDAYQTLQNAFVWRGRVLRRRGSKLLGRLRRLFNGADGYQLATPWTAATISYPIYPNLEFVDAGEPTVPIAITEANASIESGATTPIVITITTTTPHTITLTENTGTGTFSIVNSDPSEKITSATLNYQTGVITVTGTGGWTAATITISFAYYPNLPVMGLSQREITTLNDQETVGFDTRYAYKWDSGSNGWIEYPSLSDADDPTFTTWSGSDAQFFYSFCYQYSGINHILWVTNQWETPNKPTDLIQWHDGTGWNDFAPGIITNNARRLYQALLLIPYRGRLVALNTWEGADAGATHANLLTGLAASTQNPQRARWSAIGTVFPNANPAVQPQPWFSDAGNPGRGGFVDCTTDEAIVSAEFVRDTLVVGFERSTWALRYTGNEIQPFAWERLNRELGVESTFSMIPFDQGILSVGNRSINICTGNGVQPIDQDIPDEVFEIHNGSNGPVRVHGIRDYEWRQAYWTIPDGPLGRKFPNRVLVYNYENQCFSQFTDAFTCFGYHQPSNEATWASSKGTTWSAAKWPWNSGRQQSLSPDVIAGNQQGWVFSCNEVQAGDDPSLYISNVDAGAAPSVLGAVTLTIPDHNLEDGDFIKVSGIVGFGSPLNGSIFKVGRLTADTISLFTYLGPTTNLYDQALLPGQNPAAPPSLYQGLGVVKRVLNFVVLSKKFNILPSGTRNHLGYIDFLADTTQSGQISCLIFRNYADEDPVNFANLPGTNPDTFFNSAISTQPNQFDKSDPDKAWHRFYCPTNASFVSYMLTLSDAQITNDAIGGSDMSIDAVVLYSSAGGRLVDQ